MMYDEVKQVWYADDSTAVGSLTGVKKWWEYLQANGPVSLHHCTDFGIKITDQGERLLGSVIGTDSFREQYIKNKVEGWVKDLQSLSKQAQDDPQAAYSAFTKSVSSRWTLSKEQCLMRVNYMNHLKTPSEIN